MTDDDRLDAGMRVRREVLGDEHVDRAAAGASALTAAFQAYITRAAWGEVWTRPELDRRVRSLVTLALLAARVCNGVTPVEIAEVLMHTAVYAGMPAANAAMRIAQETLHELGVVDERGVTDDPAP